MSLVLQSSKWILSIISAGGTIEGATRLQKYAFLIANRVKGITDLGFPTDWKPSDYGPFSKQVAMDICHLVNRQLITEDRANKNGYTVAIFRPTQSASSWVNDVENQYPKYVESIRKIVNIYQSKRLMDVLHDVYYLYPEYAINSKIKAEVGRQTYESDSYLNPEYDYSTE